MAGLRPSTYKGTSHLSDNNDNDENLGGSCGDGNYGDGVGDVDGDGNGHGDGGRLA